MRIFVYEYACAQPRDAMPESVRVEGHAMLTALVEDFARIGGVEAEMLPESSHDTERAAFERLARAADWTVVIAPEFDGLLLERCRWVEESSGRLLGPGLGAVALTADKWATALLFEQHGVPTPRTWLAESDPASYVRGRHELPFSQMVVVKPRWSAGSRDTLLLHRDAVVPSPGFIVQDYAPGVAVSVAFLTVPASTGLPGKLQTSLCPTRQLLSEDGRLRYLGGSLPLPDPLAGRAARLATEALRPLAKLYGYVGVDLVLGAADDGSADYVIEINPRMTTSYVGLRALAEDNLAEAMLRIAAGKEIAPIRWREGAVEFDANGTVRFA